MSQKSLLELANRLDEQGTLTESNPEREQKFSKIAELYKDDEQKVKLVEEIKKYEKGLSELVKLTKDNKSHNAQGAMQIYFNLLNLNELYQQLKPFVKENLKYKGVKISSKEMLKEWDAKLAFIDFELSKIVNHYSEDIMKGAKENYKLAQELVSRYKS